MKVNCTMNILQVTPSMLYFKYEIERFSKRWNAGLYIKFYGFKSNPLINHSRNVYEKKLRKRTATGEKNVVSEGTSSFGCICHRR